MNGDDGATFGFVTPVVPARDVAASVAFYVNELGFTEAFRSGDPPDYAGVKRDDATVHLFACAERKIAEWTAFRVRVTGIDELFARCLAGGHVHPNAPLTSKPWGTREFAVVDPAGVCITFWQPD